MAISVDLIISIDKLEFYTPIQDTVDAELLTPLVVVAQDIAAQQVLGTALRDKLITDFNADSLTGVYATMYPKVEKMVIWQTFKDGLPSLLYKVANGKITKGGTEDSSPIELDELGSMIRNAESKRVFYENDLKAYLRANQNDIPEFNSSIEWYVKENLNDTNASQGLSSTPNRRYSDF